MPPDAFLGPVAFLAGALFAIGVLWREHIRSDTRERSLTDTALEGWKGSTSAADRIAAALEASNLERVDRRRIGDAPDEVAS